MGESLWRWWSRNLFWVLGACLAMLATSGLLAARSGADGSRAALPELSEVELTALARQTTLRVAVPSCHGLIRGSGFVIDGVLVTNRHLLDDALATNGAVGVKVDQPIASALVALQAVSSVHDVAVVDAPSSVALRWSVEPAEAGDTVLVAGHAGGGRVETLVGEVTARVPGESYGAGGDLLLVDVPTTGGFSGGPVLDSAGAVVGVLQGFDHSTGLTLAVPADAAAGVVSASVRLAETGVPGPLIRANEVASSCQQ